MICIPDELNCIELNWIEFASSAGNKGIPLQPPNFAISRKLNLLLQERCPLVHSIHSLLRTRSRSWAEVYTFLWDFAFGTTWILDPSPSPILFLFFFLPFFYVVAHVHQRWSDKIKQTSRYEYILYSHVSRVFAKASNKNSIADHFSPKMPIN